MPELWAIPKDNGGCRKKQEEKMKTGRNDLCHCGSKIKYKKCCMKKDERIKTMEDGKGPTNEFRDAVEKEQQTLTERIVIEAEKVGEAEMLRRDEFVLMRQLQIQKRFAEEDLAYVTIAGKVCDAFLEELALLPLSEARGAVTVMIEKQANSLAQQAVGSVFARPNVITLRLLENDLAGSTTGPKLTEDGTTAPPETVDESEDDNPDNDKYDNEDDGPAELQDEV